MSHTSMPAKCINAMLHRALWSLVLVKMRHLGRSWPDAGSLPASNLTVPLFSGTGPEL